MSNQLLEPPVVDTETPEVANQRVEKTFELRLQDCRNEIVHEQQDLRCTIEVQRVEGGEKSRGTAPYNLYVYANEKRVRVTLDKKRFDSAGYLNNAARECLFNRLLQLDEASNGNFRRLANALHEQGFSIVNEEEFVGSGAKPFSTAVMLQKR